MRILFTTLPRAGHFHPLVPIARAAAAAGHEVAVACAASFAPTVEAAGFRALPAGFDAGDRPWEVLFPALRALTATARADWIGPAVFVGVYAATLAPDLLALARDWPPDLIVRESAELGGCVAAEALGLPHASVRSSATSASYARRARYRAALAPLRERCGLAPDPGDAMPFRYLHLACEPPRFLGPGDAHAPTAHLLRPADAGPEDEPPPPWLAGLPARPTVYATLGTAFNAQPAGRATFLAILAALRDEPVNLIVTVGRDRDPATFGPQPAHVRIARYIPQGLLLPHCALVVNQGGFGTIAGALGAGVPLVLIPLGSDQPLNAACCAALGVGRVVGPDERTPATIRAAVRAVLANPTYRRNAERLRDEMAALPGPEHAVALLERLAAGKEPILAAS